MTFGPDGVVVEDLAAVPTGAPVTVYGVRGDDNVIEASFILQEVN